MQLCGFIEKGPIYLDFDARTSKGRGTALRNHGTKFRISYKDIVKLYDYNHTIGWYFFVLNSILCLTLAGRITHPTGRMAHPTGRMAHPAGRITHPTGRMAHPTGRITHPTGRITHPTGRMAHPTGRMAHPAGRITHPAGLKAHPTGLIAHPIGLKIDIPHLLEL